MQHGIVQKIEIRCNDKHLPGGKNVSEIHVADKTQEYGYTRNDIKRY